MTGPLATKGIDAARHETDRAQARAADPAASAWVSANAGTGKTHVLTNRVLRLLLGHTEPARILCLTYTKAAAAEMSTRVFNRLAGWVTAEDSDLSAALVKLTGRLPGAVELAHARTLFTSAIETPGGLKVQTIHAFAERLLQRFPLEAGVPPGFKILDDAKKRDLIARAIEATLTAATSTPDGPAGRALETAIRFASDASFDELLTRAISERAWLEAASRLGRGAPTDDEFAGAETLLRDVFDIKSKGSAADIEEERACVFSDQDLSELAALQAGGSSEDVKNSALLRAALNAGAGRERAADIEHYLLKKDGEPRARLLTKKLAEARPDLAGLAERAQRRFLALTRDLKALSTVTASLALYRLAASVLQRYTDAKAAAGALDFDDLIARTMSLLSNSDQTLWVLFKLDGGLDHILVDEAQDTSPEQWQIIEALAREFFSGSSARPDIVRTVFAVGDEKQSIYSFQGAAPEQFRLMGSLFSDRAKGAARQWQAIPLNLSFRSVQAVLDAVDDVFASAERTPGVGQEGQAIAHIASRFGHGGIVELWPVETDQEMEAADPWSPLSDASARAPVNRLAERIAAKIESWITTGECLASTGKPIRAGDILILVRKRFPFAVPMVAALKARNIPVAGSDRIELSELTAVKDLMALGDFLTLPEDDLSLAAVLKSPLLSLDDDDLMRIAPGRKGSLWKSLLAKAEGDAGLKPAAEMLKRWRAKADFTPPFEFFSDLLDRDGGRRLFMQRLGAEAADGLDEFLELAIGYDDAAPPSLTGFLASLRQSGHEVKRDMEHGRDEVRVMTVHGSKGLEAPIVFLPDTCTTASGDTPGMRLVTLHEARRPSATPPPVVWAVKGTSNLSAIAQARARQDEREREERNRLLYVAMTRARDRLYVAGFEGKKGRAKGCWYELIETALAGRLADVADGTGTVKRLETTQTEPPEVKALQEARAHDPETPPAFAMKRAPFEPQLTVPLAPSRLEPYAPDSEGEPVMQARKGPGDSYDRPSPLALADGNRFLRGTLTHALLQHLPSLPHDVRAGAAAAFVDKRGAVLKPKVRASIVAETLKVLTDPVFKDIFGAESRAEVPVAATLPRPGGGGPALKLSGQIDRLAVTEASVLIVDYKTNRPPPASPAAVAPAYLYQLAAYALALREIYPGRQLRAALLWTDGARLMEIPEATIQSYITKLWDLDPASLDAG